MEKQMDWKLEVRDLSWGVRRERGSKLMILQRVNLAGGRSAPTLSHCDRVCQRVMSKQSLIAA